MGQSENWLLVEIPKFFFKKHEAWAKLSSFEVVTITKFHNVWRKIMNISLLANFAVLAL